MTVTAPLLPVYGICLAMFRRSLRISKSGLLDAIRLINPVAALSGAFIGSWSHVALDSIMHSDIRPFAPFVDDNMLLGSLTVYELRLFCVVAGIAGAVGMGFWWLVWQERR